MSETEERALVVQIAHSWERTPYHHNAMIKGVGVDCAMLVIAVFKEAGIVEASQVDYLPQWFMNRGEEKYLNELQKYATEITEAEAQLGDVVAYKMGRTFSHGAIIIEPGWPAIIHAHQEARMVIQDRGDGGRLADRERKFFTRWGAGGGISPP